MNLRGMDKAPRVCPSWAPAGMAAQLKRPFVFFAAEEHFLEHIAPVYLAMPASRRGEVLTRRRLLPFAASLGLQASAYEVGGHGKTLIPGSGPVVVSSYGDVVRVVRSGSRPVVLFEHGAGFSFGTRHPSYAGGAQLRTRVGLFVGPNDFVANRNRWAFPEAPTASVGCPKLDEWHSRKRRKKRSSKRPVACLSFHWDCKVAPETRWALPHYATALPRIVDELEERYEVVLHGHPRARHYWKQLAEGLHLEFVEEFRDVLERADLYINDASSTLYEFASTGRPVVVLNAPWYRRTADLGLRFWRHADVGVNVDEPADLVAGVERAFEEREEDVLARRAAVDAAYTVHDGTAAATAAAALVTWSDSAVLTNGKPYRLAMKRLETTKGVAP